MFAGFFLLLGSIISVAQTLPTGVGQWRVHFPYKDLYGLAETPSHIYTYASSGFFRYDKAANAVEVLSKVNGYSDFEVSCMQYSAVNNTLIIAYANTNMDMIKGNRLINVQDILRSSITGLKKINHISYYNNYALLACSFGIHVYNLNKMESSATYLSTLFSDVKAAAVYDNYVYAATDNGIFRAALPPVGISINPASWQLFRPGKATLLHTFDNRLYAAIDSSLEYFDNTSWTFLENNRQYRSFDEAYGKLVITTDTAFRIIDNNGNSTINYENAARYGIVDASNNIWFASIGYGLIKKRPDNGLEYFTPDGPYGLATGKMISKDGNMWIAGGAVVPGGGGETYTYNGYYRLEKEGWYSSIGKNALLDTLNDLYSVVIDPLSKDIWMAAYTKALFSLKNDNPAQVYTADNSPIQLGPAQYISALAFDKNNHLWVGNFNAATPLLVKTASNQWDSFPLPGGASKVNDIIVDRNNRKWILFAGSLGINPGIVVYDDRNTPLSKGDDISRVLGKGTGNGNLPENQVTCFAADKDGEIWVGTSLGLAIFFNPSNILSSNPSDAQQLVIKTGQDLGVLMGTEYITSIVVDGGNRKWIATRSGLWLVAADGNQILLHWDTDNSPLLSNNILEMSMNEMTGELFISTDKGLISYKTDATEGGDTHGDVLVYPNPVRPEYDGLISVRGLPENAFVKITDIAGNLVYETQANGGMVTWNGKNFSGRRASSGVYMVFSSNSDGTDTFVSKILFISK